MTDHLALAEKALHGSEQKKWAACLIAARYVGERQNGWAQELADRLGYTDVSRISDLADAGKARKALRMKASEVYKFRISVFTFCHKVIKQGNDPHLVALVLKEILEEVPRPKMKDVTDILAGTFNVPTREPTAGTWLKTLDRMVSWGAQKIDHQHRKEWDEHTAGIRRILKGIK